MYEICPSSLAEVAKCTGGHSHCTVTPEQKAVDACLSGNVKALCTLLHAGVNINHATGDTNATLPHMAAYHGQVSVLTCA